jgi:hypothetical protein
MDDHEAHIEEIRVTSWGDLNAQLFDGAWNPDLGRLRSRFVYRGLNRARCDLSTGLMRLGGDYARLEHTTLRNFQKYARREDVPGDTEWDWLALAQHYGLPTRLLDWTYSPFVALHFVTEDLASVAGHAAEDGVVWCVDRVGALDALPSSLRAVLAEDDSTAFTAEMLSRVAASLHDLDALAPRECVIFFDPPALDQRIINQFALFSLMSYPSARGLPWRPFDAWLGSHPRLARRLLIPAALKPRIRDIRDIRDEIKPHRARALSRPRRPRPLAPPLLHAPFSLVLPASRAWERDDPRPFRARREGRGAKGAARRILLAFP